MHVYAFFGDGMVAGFVSRLSMGTHAVTAKAVEHAVGEEGSTCGARPSVHRSVAQSTGCLTGVTRGRSSCIELVCGHAGESSGSISSSHLGGGEDGWWSATAAALVFGPLESHPKYQVIDCLKEFYRIQARTMTTSFSSLGW